MRVASRGIEPACALSRPDVVVVGAGAIGASCAYYLARADLSVTLIDRGTGTDGASFGNAGMIVPSHVVPLAAPGVISQGLRWLFSSASPFYIRPRASPDLLRWLWRFRASCTADHVRRSVPLLRDMALESVELLSELEATGAIDSRLQRRGLLMLHRTSAGRHHNSELAEVAAEAGLEVREMDAAAVRALDGGVRSETSGGVFYPQDCHLDPSRLVRSLLATVEGLGVEVRHATEVTGIEHRGGRATGVRTARGVVPAGVIVLAGGAFTPRLASTAGLRVPVEAAKGYSVTLPRGSAGLATPLILTDSRVTITPIGDRLRFAGTLELAGLDDSIDVRRLRSIVREIPDYLPAVDVAGLLRAAEQERANSVADAERVGSAAEAERAGSAALAAGPGGEVRPQVWSGFRPCSPDGLPIIGLAPGVDGVVIATGHGMTGITLAPVTGRIVADLVSGESSSVPSAALAPARFS